MKKEMTLKARFILTSYCSVVISIMLIGIASYCLLGSMSKKFVLQTSEEAVRQKNEDIQTKLDGIEVSDKLVCTLNLIRPAVRLPRQPFAGSIRTDSGTARVCGGNIPGQEAYVCPAVQIGLLESS